MSLSPNKNQDRAEGCQTPLRVITLDGPAGVGKSTLARRLAESLGLAYLDTGAMFRTVALHLARSGAGQGNAGFEPASVKAEELERLFTACEFSLEGSGNATRLLCNGVPVGDEIRSEEAGMMAAKAAQMPRVREFLKEVQQDLGRRFSLVAEGRDMGTVVFPDAGCKIFLDAEPSVRAERRYLQLKQMGMEADLDSLTEQIRLRDEQDRNRAIAPLVPAGDARRIDTSSLDIDGVFEVIMGHVAAAFGDAGGDAPPCRAMRRKKRTLNMDETMGILERGEYGVLSLLDPSGWPYAVPLSYVLMDGALYFHCALTGRKIDAITACERGCFTVVGETQPVYEDDFSTYYESAMVFGHVRLVKEEGERRRSLWALAEKYLPDHMDKADKDIQRSFSRTAVYKISLESVSGKAKRPAVQQAGVTSSGV